MLPGVFTLRNSRGSNAMKMLKNALATCVLLALSPAAASAADFGPYPPERPYAEAPAAPPPAYYARPYYPDPYCCDTYYYGYYGPRFWRPFPYYAAYPYWRGPRFAHYGRPYWGGAHYGRPYWGGAHYGRPYWGGGWRGHGRRW